jgi:hypothetical protein
MKANSWPVLVAGLSLLVLGGFFVQTSSASAHERRNVLSYTFVVGFLNEPAYLNQPNSIDLRVSKTSDSSPVSGLEKTLKADISTSDQKMNIDLTPRFNTPGAYNAPFTPTKTGAYTFHFAGTIEGSPVDEKFTSSPSTFGAVEEPKTFPATLPSNQNLEERLVALESAPRPSSSNKADTALIVGIVGVVLGAAGVVMGGYSLMRKPA